MSASRQDSQTAAVAIIGTGFGGLSMANQIKGIAKGDIAAQVKFFDRLFESAA